MIDNRLIMYKLIILYMLDRVDFPLTNSQISQFVLEKGYTNYFTLQETINDLTNSEFITSSTIRNASHYEITPSGHEAMDLFDSKLSDAIKLDILHYFEENKIHLKNESNIYADYTPTNSGYETTCTVKEKSDTILEIKILAPSKERAIEICDNWQEKSEEMYDYLIKNL